MLILNTSSKIAIKCGKCGKYNTSDLNIFNLKSTNTVKCECEKELITSHINSNSIIFKIYCIACEEYHIFKLSIKDVLEKNINILACPISGMEIAFLGKTPYIEDIVEKYINDMLNLLKFIGIVEDKSKKVLE